MLRHHGNKAVMLWMTDRQTVCHLAEWLSRQMDRRMNGFMLRWIHAYSLGMNPYNEIWLNYSNKQRNRNDSRKNPRILTANLNSVSLEGLDSQNLNVATTEVDTSGKQADELSGNKDTAHWVEFRVLESTEEIVLRIHSETT